MINEKFIVALLLVAIVFSVLTLIVSLSSDSIPNPKNSMNFEEAGTASIILQIIPRSSLGEES